MNSVYKRVLKFKNRYPGTIAWRLKQNASIIEKHLNPGEDVIYAFAAQKNDNVFNIFETAVVALTNKRILIGRKRVLFGYFFNSITPDMFNDMKVSGGLIWGKVFIDTVKEFVTLSNISNAALTEIETEITTYMMEEKKKYANEFSDGD
ncbi:MAG: PH domain-containing protein [Bacilli bacterium]|nr:PH domain-containing protein [Bacilli bacterium]